ncbi:glutamine--fructose-6-phosphate transaminase (isomerizing) [Pedomonas mirosovicensis]|uniref:glutamine--fructose-6-phosphate transaminase (isomerizing) n=1 Tax=Pedomonas mirosovicensis TaxID=2908641 RepID=UPI0021679A7C|nr:glutamine--fructose-6-phosphate transaminase (isomerizing) [Pedomonas mirosovicensis]MCH8684343.1 glutamine--fructose-6-phosphate transaminase (isomerizing) [Pedomonas mirosovicensis]
MCGIIGIIGQEPVADRLLDGLRRLEYRGYDSAGICTLVDGALARCRAEGKLKNLERRLIEAPLAGELGIAHTRWATHGAPTESNAHPHASRHVAVVHNGIIENFKQLRQELVANGYAFESETDTEVVVHLISAEMDQGAGPVEAVQRTLKRLHGAFALAILFSGHDDLMIGARRGSPLVVGYGDGEMYLGSDAIALSDLTSRIAYLDEGDWVVLSRTSIQVYDADDRPVERPVTISTVTGGLIDKGNHRHYMQKEIYEQPTVVAQTLGTYIRPLDGRIALPDLPFDLASVERVSIIACGTSYYAGMVGKYWLEQMARVPVELDIASEFRYRDPVLTPGGLAIFISQSGETADTLAALRHCKENGQHTVAIVNVPTSSMAREAHAVLPTHAGPEIGVASTKAFTCQLATLSAFAIAMAQAKGKVDEEREAALVQCLTEIPAYMNEALAHDEDIAKLAHAVARATDVLYLGRGPDYPIALEGALKLKEISYIHAEGYAAGEMKHGPIALIDENVPVVVVAPSGPLFEKTISNMQEVIARGGQVILISDKEGLAHHGTGLMATIEMPKVDGIIAPLVYAVPVQLLAYHVAVAKGTDVDQPRNLAKSVTVE